MQLVRLIRTLVHLRPGQIYWRGRYLLERRLGWHRVPPVPDAVPAWNAEALARLRDLAERWTILEANGRAPGQAAAFRAERFTFCSDTADFTGGIDWTSAQHWRLWRYQLHYFDCAKALVLAPESGDADVVRAWVLDWMAKNPPVTDVAWDAFTISARMLNWGLAAARWGLDDVEIRRSYLHQARYLATHLERDVQANHLLKNACALCVAGSLIAPDLLATGLALLRAELPEQILNDGGHYERAPMYHALVLEDLIVTQAALGARGDFLTPYIVKMAAFLDGILNPDGEIPFFGDSVLGEARGPGVLLALAGYTRSEKQEATASFPDSGFHVLRDPVAQLHLIFKAGPPGPGYQLGHAHADCLSYELSIGGERVIVNSGVHGYADSPYRDYCRSEAAHNTVAVAGHPQLELWGAFRVGRRYRIGKAITFRNEDPTIHGVVAAGYCQLKRGPLNFAILGAERSIAVSRRGDSADVPPAESEGPLIVVTEKCSGHRGEPITSRIHLAPGLKWQDDDGESISAVRSDTVLFRLRYRKMSVPTKARVEEGYYFPEFGVTKASSVLVLEYQSKVYLGYEITLP